MKSPILEIENGKSSVNFFLLITVKIIYIYIYIYIYIKASAIQ
jgi:hypothetical protein